MKKTVPGTICAVLAIIILAACCFLLPSGKILPEAQQAYDSAILETAENPGTQNDGSVINWSGLDMTGDAGIILLPGMEEDASPEGPEAMQETGLKFRKYGFVIAASAVVALAAGWLLTCKNRRETMQDMCVFGLICVAGGLILSRLLYVACSCTQSWCNSAFRKDLGIFRVWDGGLSMTGVLAAMLLAGLFIPSCRQVTGLSAPLFIAGARLAEMFTGTSGNFKSGLGFGISLGESEGGTVPWYALLDSEYDSLRLNVRLFEVIIALIIFAAVLVIPYLLKKRRICRRGDYRLPLFLVLYGMTQIMMECLRDDEHMAFTFFLKAQQITAMIFAMIGLFILSKPLKKYLFFAAMCAEVVIPVIALEFMMDRTNTAHIWCYAGMALFLARFIWAAGYSIHRQYYCESAGLPEKLPQ